MADATKLIAGLLLISVDSESIKWLGPSEAWQVLRRSLSESVPHRVHAKRWLDLSAETPWFFQDAPIVLPCAYCRSFRCGCDADRPPTRRLGCERQRHLAGKKSYA